MKFLLSSKLGEQRWDNRSSALLWWIIRNKFRITFQVISEFISGVTHALYLTWPVYLFITLMRRISSYKQGPRGPTTTTIFYKNGKVCFGRENRGTNFFCGKKILTIVSFSNFLAVKTLAFSRLTLPLYLPTYFHLRTKIFQMSNFKKSHKIFFLIHADSARENS